MTFPLIVEPVAIANAEPSSMKVVDLRPEETRIAGHIPGSVALSPTLLNRPAPPVGGLLPEPQVVSAILDGLALNHSQQIVAVDAGASTEAARLTWVLHAYGHTNCSWLNGGMRAWADAGLPLQRGAAQASITPATNEASAGASATAEIIDPDSLLTQLNDPDLAILDVRSEAEFRGTDVRSAEGGHVPGAGHLEWTRLLAPDGRLLDDETLLALLADAGLTPGKRAVVYCQTHQRSAVTWLALKHLGFSALALDGAWSAWGNRADLPKETQSSASLQ